MVFLAVVGAQAFVGIAAISSVPTLADSIASLSLLMLLSVTILLIFLLLLTLSFADVLVAVGVPL